MNYVVKLIDRNLAKSMIEKWHYSHSINGLMGSYYFGLFDHNDDFLGAMIYGKPAMANQWKKYVSDPSKLLELRRLALIDDTPRNSESYFIGKTLKWLGKNTDLEVIISYADSNYGHSGIIYKASNFQYLGLTAPGRVIFWNDKKYHDKAIRTKYKGQLKPFAIRLKAALESGEAHYEKQLPKHIYLYKLRK